MSEAADSLNDDEIPRAGTAVAQCVKGRDTGAKQRARLRCVEAVRNCCETLGWSEHIFLVTAVKMDARDSFVRAGDKVAFPACRASKVMAAVPADADSLAFLPVRDTRAGFVNNACNFVAGHARILDARKNAVFRQMVAETNSAGLHLDAHLPSTRLRNFALHNFKVAARFRHLNRFHFCHR